MKDPVTRLDYCQYLLVTQINYTLTYFADHCEKFSHDAYEQWVPGLFRGMLGKSQSAAGKGKEIVGVSDCGVIGNVPVNQMENVVPDTDGHGSRTEKIYGTCGTPPGMGLGLDDGIVIHREIIKGDRILASGIEQTKPAVVHGHIIGYP